MIPGCHGDVTTTYILLFNLKITMIAKINSISTTVNFCSKSPFRELDCINLTSFPRRPTFFFAFHFRLCLFRRRCFIFILTVICIPGHVIFEILFVCFSGTFGFRRLLSLTSTSLFGCVFINNFIIFLVLG